jgi:hypothetical protein
MISHPNLPRIHRPPEVYLTPPSLPSSYLMSTSTERVGIITSCNVPPTKAKMYCSKPQEYGHNSANKYRLQQSNSRRARISSGYLTHYTVGILVEPILKSLKGRHYKEVHVLMFLWEDDDLHVRGEVLQLRNLFSSLYNFTTHISTIPSKKILLNMQCVK